ncbi:hypothetical protein, partial [Halorientalis regularis]|uniref:hypothetical protein n=1 Tax=Halorientalis regularis TaxID=660518 RepID=UPI001C31B4D6
PLKHDSFGMENQSSVSPGWSGGVYGRHKREATAGIPDVRVGRGGMGQAWWAVYHGSEGQVTADRN